MYVSFVDARELLKDSANAAQARTLHAPIQERALKTRRDLMEAARIIFSRDGFERARLVDIAAAAGKTRGAFYTNFKDKEDLFFALFEQDTERDLEHFQSLAGGKKSRKARVELLVGHLLEILKNEQRMLLLLELKLYVVRHAHRRKRAKELQVSLQTTVAGLDFGSAIPGLAPVGSNERRSQVAEFSALMDGLALNRLYDPASLSDGRLSEKLSAWVDAILR